MIEINLLSHTLSDQFAVAITRKCNLNIATEPYNNYIGIY